MQMRRMDKLMKQDAMEQVMKEAEYGVLSTVGDGNEPYGVPMNFVYENETHKIYFHGTSAEGHRNQNIQKQSNVCFTVVRNVELLPDSFSTKFESVISFGRIRVVDTGKEEILKKLLEKYSPEHMEKGMDYIHSAMDKVCVYEMDITEMTGKAKY